MRWRFGWLLAAPHRLGFFAGATMLAGSGLWWAIVLLARAAGWALPWALPEQQAHALLMAFGFMPMFFVGFLFTAGPRWLNVTGPSALQLRLPIVAMLAGWGVFIVGVHDDAQVAGIGLAAVALGWSLLVGRFAGLLRASRVADKTHPRLVAGGSVLIALLLWLAAAGVLAQHETWVRAAALAGLWGGIALVYTSVAHRMIPFFSASAVPLLDAWRPMWLLWTLAGALLFEALFAAAEAAWWPLPAGVRWGQVLVEAQVGALLLWLAWRWGLVQSLKVRLLAMLHLGFLWLGIALSLSAVSHALQASTAGALSLGLAPLHALTMGFLGSTLIAMATRVSCGHGGRTLAADGFVWALFWLLQVAVVLRLGAALWPAFEQRLLLPAVLVWAACTIGWSLRYGRWFGLPRADGRPG
jgi:uncharacterized protein involved in response to NO